MLQYLPGAVRNKAHLYFMGSGELEDELKNMAAGAETECGVKCYFAGFVNQSQLAAHYLAMDVMVLPSRRMGETWGLVANEAMQAGCGVIVSNAVGSGTDFAALDRFRVFKEGDQIDLAEKVMSLVGYKRDFDWAKSSLHEYRIESTAEALLKSL